ncbi:hypothetical protein B0H16DRAFT_1446428 [Mycena metata]|uniref:Uncharacterized protein n=1 Tax=Mycena metata TaxID=1033252 RepID=A0AAD7P157_9AGAR|nr:hypothetical protein B0H16DRAFT_1446428 [Mycena metata]
MTAASWCLTGVGPTLAMALARRWLGSLFHQLSFMLSNFPTRYREPGVPEAPGLNPDAEPIQCETQVGGGENQESTYGREEMCETRLSLPTPTREQRNWPTPSQCLANAMASIGPTPVKHHEAAAMALTGCVMRDKKGEHWNTGVEVHALLKKSTARSSKQPADLLGLRGAFIEKALYQLDYTTSPIYFSAFHSTS